MISLKHGILPLFLIAGAILPASELNVPQQKAWRGNMAKSASQAETFKPVLSGDAIVCGNKKAVWSRDGQIKIVNAGGVLLSLTPYFVYMNEQKKVDWSSFTLALCQVKTEDGKVVWTFKKKLGDQVYDAGTQTLEITPEGLLKVRCNITAIQAPGWQPWRRTGDFFFTLPFSRADGKMAGFNGARRKMDSGVKTIFFDRREKVKRFNYIFYPDSPADMIGLNAEKPEVGGTTACYPVKNNKEFRVTLEMNKETSCAFTLDIRKGIREVKSPDKRGGIDFQAIEKLELPDNSRRNLLVNSSFERGIAGYCIQHPGNAYWEGKWDWKPFEVVKDPTAPFGKHVLRLDARVNDREDYRQLVKAANITTHVVVAPAGTYTISFYAKGEKGKTTEISLWVPQFHRGSYGTR